MKTLALISQTFLELKSKATLAVLAGLSTLIILATAIGLSVQESDLGSTVLIFGNVVSPPMPAHMLSSIVEKVEAAMASGMFAGLVIFGIFATAGVIPDLLEKGTVDLFLSKPVARWHILSGKFAGAALVVLANVVYFIGALWLILGFKTGVWNLLFLSSTVLLTFSFCCLYSLVLFLGVISRNTALSIIGAFLYLFVVSGLLANRETILYLVSENPLYRRSIDGLFYALPQINGMLETIPKVIVGEELNWKPYLQAFLSASAIFACSTLVFRRKDF